VTFAIYKTLFICDHNVKVTTCYSCIRPCPLEAIIISVIILYTSTQNVPDSISFLRIFLLLAGYNILSAHKTLISTPDTEMCIVKHFAHIRN